MTLSMISIIYNMYFTLRISVDGLLRCLAEGSTTTLLFACQHLNANRWQYDASMPLFPIILPYAYQIPFIFLVLQDPFLCIILSLLIIHHITFIVQTVPTMANITQYQPLKWPPDIPLAQLHFNCTKPGIDNTEGAKCPCCDRFEKLENSKWPSRDIAKDFKNYGGGVPGYFYLLWYFIAILLFLTLVKVIYHILLIQRVCTYIEDHYQRIPENNALFCSSFFGIRFCDSSILQSQLSLMGKTQDWQILQYLQLTTYLVLVLATVGIKIFFQLVNKDKISLDEKLFSRFALVIKNVPLYYQLDDLKEELKEIEPKVEINEMFYLHKSHHFSTTYRQLFDLYYQIRNLQQDIQCDDRQKKVAELRLKYEEYLSLYDQAEVLKENMNKNSKKILVVFNTIQQKERIHQMLKMNEGLKFLHYMSKMLQFKSDPIGYYTERVAEPQEIYWNNIGESSTHKQKVRMQTTFIGIGFMFLSFAIFYFPMYKIDEEKYNRPGLGTGLGLLISILIIILAIVYRLIIVRMMPTRRPSSKLAESYFIVMTTVVFHFFFYLVTPATFYLLASEVPKNMKLKEFFSAIFSFVLMCLIVALIDMRYRLAKKNREKLLSQANEANRYCQQRLHEQVTPTSFPIEFKLMVAFNIWSFNSFYIFQIPYLIFLFTIVLFLLYWIDKYNLYKHYKMQQYLSIQLEIKAQKTYIVLFLICVSIGYFYAVYTAWERWMILGVITLALMLNFALNYSYKKHKDSILKHNTDLKSAIQNCKSSFGKNMHLQMLEQELKRSFLAAPEGLEFSSASLASEVASYGYLETYHLFLNQFKNKELNHLLEEKCYSIKHSKTILDGRKRKESELVRLAEDTLADKLIQREIQEGQASRENLNHEDYVPPVVVVTEPIIDSRPIVKEPSEPSEPNGE